MLKEEIYRLYLTIKEYLEYAAAVVKSCFTPTEAFYAQDVANSTAYGSIEEVKRRTPIVYWNKLKRNLNH